MLCPFVFWFFSGQVPTFTVMSFPFRQYLRALLVPLGLADRRAYELVLDKVLESDTFIVSYPKSGNTWMRFIVAYLHSGREKITFREIDQYVADIYSHRGQANAMSSPRFLKSHQSCYEHYPRMIYLVRDYRDVLVSYYHYHTALGTFKGTIEAYCTAVNSLHPFGTWKDHVGKALEFQRMSADRILLIRYEDLINQPVQEVERVARFIGHTRSSVAEVVQKSQFALLREEENVSGSQFMDLGKKNFFREGKVGSWKTDLPEEVAARISREHKDLFEQLGYLS